MCVCVCVCMCHAVRVPVLSIRLVCWVDTVRIDSCIMASFLFLLSSSPPHARSPPVSFPTLSLLHARAPPSFSCSPVVPPLLHACASPPFLAPAPPPYFACPPLFFFPSATRPCPLRHARTPLHFVTAPAPCPLLFLERDSSSASSRPHSRRPALRHPP